MKDELELNRVHWDESTRVHLRGDLYGLETFKAGGCRLHRVELEEVGDVKGKRLLHLQCHFGLDTLSWARHGAIVTGVDFSTESIAAARRLAADTGIEAEFVCCDLYELPEALLSFHSFDIVYTSYGVLCWLPDLAPWAALIAHYLKPGGLFYIAEAHPCTAHVSPGRGLAEDRRLSPLALLFSRRRGNPVAGRRRLRGSRGLAHSAHARLAAFDGRHHQRAHQRRDDD